jgi:hypothetical protein
MTTDEFEAFVKSNEEWFRGRLAETELSLTEAERSLGVALPQSLRWLLKEYGYWHGTAVSNLEDTVKDTLAAREHLGLPANFVVLENHEDGGLIIINTSEQSCRGEPALYWVGYEDLGEVPELAGSHRFGSYGDYVAYLLPSVQKIIPPEDIRYDPRKYPEGAQDA